MIALQGLSGEVMVSSPKRYSSSSTCCNVQPCSKQNMMMASRRPLQYSSLTWAAWSRRFVYWSESPMANANASILSREPRRVPTNIW